MSLARDIFLKYYFSVDFPTNQKQLFLSIFDPNEWLNQRESKRKDSGSPESIGRKS